MDSDKEKDIESLVSLYETTENNLVKDNDTYLIKSPIQSPSKP